MNDDRPIYMISVAAERLRWRDQRGHRLCIDAEPRVAELRAA